MATVVKAAVTDPETFQHDVGGPALYCHQQSLEHFPKTVFDRSAAPLYPALALLSMQPGPYSFEGLSREGI